MKKRKSIYFIRDIDSGGFFMKMHKQIGDRVESMLRVSPWGALCNGKSIGKIHDSVQGNLFKSGFDNEET